MFRVIQTITPPDTVWILGGVEKVNKENFFICRISDRTVNTLSSVLENFLLVGTKLSTDGHPSYPRVAENLGLRHRVVVHSSNFVSPEGTHTNNIEGFWAHLKASMRKEGGVKRRDIDNWLVQYSFKRRYILNSDRETFALIYIEILKIYFSLE